MADDEDDDTQQPPDEDQGQQPPDPSAMVPYDDIASSDVKDTDDGGAIVTMGDDEEEDAEQAEFYANLAETMKDYELKSLATDMLELIDRDKEARTKRDEQYAEGIRRTGLGDEAPGGANFEGATKVVHPMLVEACIDFASRAMKELWPADGPVKTKIEGEETDEKDDKADRKADLMNWQLTVQSQEFRAEVEQVLTQVPLGGAQYLKMLWDHRRNRPQGLAVFIDDMLIPFAATNFYSAERKTHVQYLTEQEYRGRVRDGMYRDVDVVPTGLEPETTAAGKASDKVEGRDGTAYNEDGLRTVYETYAMVELDGDDEPKPYIITTDKSTTDVLAIYRNWDEDDETFEALEWIVEFPFVPWRGAYPIGLPHMIGGLSGAATGALRALLDSAHINNAATGLKLKGAQIGGQTRSPVVGEILEIDGGLQVDDIRKVFMPMPYNPPSPVLFQLLGFLVDAGKGVVRTTLEEDADSNPNTPVGTTLARMEQGMVVFSAIHGRLHAAMGRMIRILHRFNRMYLNDADIKREVGDDMAVRRDFEGPEDVVPVSDPNIFTEAQRYAQAQAVTQRSQLLPTVYDLRKVEERLLKTLKVPNYEELLVPATQPEAQNPVAENVAMSLGRPVVAFPQQDHMAHIQTHTAFFANPALGQNPMFHSNFIPAFTGHMREHLVLLYMQQSIDLAEQYTGLDIDKAMQHHEGDEDYKALDRLLAQTSTVVGEHMMETMQKLMPIMQQAMQMAQQLAPPQPMDPVQAQVAATQAETQVQQGSLQLAQQKAQQEAQQVAQKTALTAQTDQAKIAQQGQAEQLKAQTEAAREQSRREGEDQRTAADMANAEANRQSEERRTQAEIESRESMNEADNLTAENLAALDAQEGKRTDLKTGTGINPKP